MRHVGIVLAVIMLSGCFRGHDNGIDTGGPPTQLNAAWLCGQYTPAPHVSAEVTTVDAFRSTPIGTIGPTQQRRFPELAATTAAAWCWTGKPGAYSVYEVAGDGEKMLVVSGIDGVAAADAHGPPDMP